MTRKTTTKGPKAAPQGQTALPAAPEATSSKIDQVVALLRRPQGATIEAMIAATGMAGPHGARRDVRRPEEEGRADHHVREG